MKLYTVELRLQSDAIFGNGQSVPGLVDLDIIYDEYGLPYFKGKTFKGKLREEVENIADRLEMIAPHLNTKNIVKKLFGDEGKSNLDGIKFSDCTLPSGVVESIKWAIEENMFHPDEVLESLTDIQSFTSIDTTGRAKKGSLRMYRLVQKGLMFVCTLEVTRELEQIEEELLAAGLKSLRHIGSMESKGKGQISNSIFIDGEECTTKLIESLERRVKSA